ncbi:hypothetical protein HID58_066883, partial [Brassica napus]
RDSSYSLWVTGPKFIQPPGSRTKVHPVFGFLDTSHEFQKDWPRINGIVQLVVPPSLFGMDTTAHHEEHVQEFYSGTKSQLVIFKYQDEHAERPLAKSQGTIPRRGKKLQLQHQNLKEHQIIQAQEAQARPAGSSMRILSFGLRVLLNLLIPLILSLAKILPLRILGSSISIWGMSRSITLYTYATGFSVKPSANSDQSPPWGLSESRVIHLQSGCKSFHAERKYILALPTRKFDGSGYELASYSKLNEELDTTAQLTKSYEENHDISCLQT